MATNVNTQAGTAGEAGTNSLIDPDSDDDRGIIIRVRTFHLDCSGVLVGDQIDEDVFCEVQNERFRLGCLADLNEDALDKMICEVISRNGSDDHGVTTTECRIVTFEFIYDEEDQEPRSLEGESDEELRRIIARGSGVVYVEWEWNVSTPALTEDNNSSDGDS